jgi:hypothetical protein
MSVPLVLVSGSKGGVGKSLASMALLDHWRALGRSVFLVETDHSNPDVWKAYNALVPSVTLDLAESDSWIELVNELERRPQDWVVVNMASMSNQAVERHGGTLLEALKPLKRDLVCLWLINRQRDSIELLVTFRELMPEAKVHVLRNGMLGAEQKFEIYNGSKQRQAVEQAGGKSVMFPELSDRVADYLYTQRSSIEKALKSLPMGDGGALNRWRKRCVAMFEELGL